MHGREVIGEINKIYIGCSHGIRKLCEDKIRQKYPQLVIVQDPKVAELILIIGQMDSSLLQRYSDIARKKMCYLSQSQITQGRTGRIDVILANKKAEKERDL